MPSPEFKTTPKKIGLTGGNGFIGGSVAKALALQGHTVVSLDHLTKNRAPDRFLLKNSPNDLDWVLHFGARTSIHASYETPFAFYADNLDSTLLALNIAHLCNAAFVFMSSYVYGHPEYSPIDEKHPVRAVNPYMASKVTGEEICRHFNQMLDMPLIILRGFNIYGDCRIRGRLIPDLVQAVRSKERLTVNDPKPRRDYLYIKDFCSLILKIVTRANIPSGVYNVGHGRSYSNLEVAQIISALARSDKTVKVRSNPRPNDINDCSVNVNLIQQTFAWRPEYSLRQGLSELLGYENREKIK